MAIFLCSRYPKESTFELDGELRREEEEGRDGMGDGILVMGWEM